MGVTDDAKVAPHLTKSSSSHSMDSMWFVHQHIQLTPRILEIDRFRMTRARGASKCREDDPVF